MIALLLIVVFTVLGILIKVNISSEVTWLDYYNGALGGLLVSGLLLHFSNKRRRAKELKEEKNINKSTK